jgi:small multidrug resistance pump
MAGAAFHHSGLSCYLAGSVAAHPVRAKPWMVHMHYLFLVIAVVGEVVGTSTLKATDGFSKLWPTLVVVIAYGIAFYFLSLSVQRFPIGVLYAVWSGLGVVLIALAGYVIYGDRLDLPAIGGLVLIVAGVATIQLFSDTVRH